MTRLPVTLPEFGVTGKTITRSTTYRERLGQLNRAFAEAEDIRSLHQIAAEAILSTSYRPTDISHLLEYHICVHRAKIVNPDAKPKIRLNANSTIDEVRDYISIELGGKHIPKRATVEAWKQQHKSTWLLRVKEHVDHWRAELC